ncbi:hypothetical protein DFR64_1272 [Pelolinea submarina]|uniref:Uncharacterized protein n=1 Tax=Pelolinea submarina TaxID=913107 RepID=A0A3E0AI89_9CHLR|nr:hypothetical protein DFR64_1272 [Pelolinea submarina]
MNLCIENNKILKALGENLESLNIANIPRYKGMLVFFILEKCKLTEFYLVLVQSFVNRIFSTF